MITETKQKNKAKTAKLRLVAIDETEHWREDIVAACKKIKAVYMYDENQHTHLCEAAPSHYLIHLYNFADTDEEISDEMYDNIYDGNGDEDNIYVHVSDIENMKTEKASFSHHLDGGLRYYASNGKKYQEIIEAAREYFLGNHPF